MKWLWILLAAFILADLLIVAYVLATRKRRAPNPESLKLVRNVWPTITSRLDSDPSGAVMDADKLLAHMLDRLGYIGTMADKLKTAQSRFSDKESLWWAHKLRNRVVHEVNVVVTPNDSRKAIRAYERALRDLRLM